MPVLLTRTELEAETLRRSFRRFAEAAWPVLEPVPFVSGFHIDAICAHLEALSRGEIHRLLINVPPRHGKSLLVSVLWPAWVWATRPETRWLCASYASFLALRDSGRCRRLIDSVWYRERFGARVQLREDVNAKERFELTAGGGRVATGVGGAATGEGGDVIVIDDPHKVEEATSAASREATKEWFTGTMSTRHNDPRSGATVVIGQRLHEDDLFGFLLAQGGWEHLCLPAEFEQSHPFRWPEDPRTTEGELLWPELHSRAVVETLKSALGSRQAAGQLQQRPAPAEGATFKRHWWRYYPPDSPPGPFEEVIQSWDLTFGDSPKADYVVGQVWGKAGPDKYLLRQIRDRFGFPEQLQAMRELTEWVNAAYPEQRGHAIVVEDAANAKALVSVLRLEIPSLILEPPQGSKHIRAEAVTPQVEAGNVFLPGAGSPDGTGCDRARTPEWVRTFLTEAETFPNGAYDDQVDAMAQALTRLTRPQPQLRVLSSRAHRRPLGGSNRRTFGR